ncbi:MAG: Na+/H+ antiporter subunit D [Clostridia bacterium]|nr:Na+/H+ antiporter subunit D [Clostridia bacterium]
MNNLVIWPIIIPLLTGISLIFLQKNRVAQKSVAVMGSLISLFYALFLAYQVKTGGILVLQASAWQAPFGISLVADVLATLLVVTANVVATACLYYSFKVIDRKQEQFYYYPFLFFLLTGVSGAFLTGDIFNLFVFFEVMLMSSYALIVFGGTKPQLRESVKYIAINVLSSALFVMAVGYLYSVVGTLNMADLAVKIKEANQVGLLNTVAMLFFIVFALKAALFPLFFWLPGSYSAPPAPIAALFGGLLTKVGIYSLIRVFTMIFAYNTGYTHTFLIWVAGLTMVFGVIGAVASMDVRKILAYNIVSAVGFMIMGLGVFTTVSIAGAIYYMIHDMIIKAALFLLGGAVITVAGTANLNKMGGLIKNHPTLGWLFFTAAVALVGIPPLSGFTGKLLLIQGALGAGQYWITGISLTVSLLILFSVMKIFLYGFWGEAKTSLQVKQGSTKGLLWPTALLIAISLFLGLGTEFFYPYVETAAQQLTDPSDYINSVLKE